MKFDKSRVYTALNADELKIGSKCIFANCLADLMDAVENDKKKQVGRFTKAFDCDYIARFCDNYGGNFVLAYLVEPPKEPQYRPFEDADEAVRVITAHGGWVKSKNSALQFIVVVKDQNLVTLSSGGIFDPQELFQHFCLADDDSPCGVPVEE